MVPIGKVFASCFFLGSFLCFQAALAVLAIRMTIMAGLLETLAREEEEVRFCKCCLVANTQKRAWHGVCDCK